MRAIPSDVSRLSVPVPVASLVVLVEHGVLSCSPLGVSIWHWRVLGKNTGKIPPEEVWVVEEGTSVELMVVGYKGSLESKTSSESLGNEEHQVGVSNPASNVEVLNRQLSNHRDSKQASELSSGCIAGPVPV